MKRTTLAVVGVLVLGSAVLAGSAEAVPSRAAVPHFRVTVSGQSRTAAPGARWWFGVRAVDASGDPVKATAIVRVFAGGHRIDTIGWFGLHKGTLRHSYRWSAKLRGKTAVLQVKVVGPGGTRTARYYVHVGAATAPNRPQFTAAVTGQTRTPVAGKAWTFTVRAVTKNGKRFNGTAIMQVLVGGKVVDTIGWFGFKGFLRKTYHWSSTLKGDKAVLRAKIVGPGGTRILAYAVTVR